MPLELKRPSEKGYEPATEHPLHDLLKFGPAPWLSPYKWRKAVAHAAMALGNSYSRARCDGQGCRRAPQGLALTAAEGSS